jgi:ABC-type histidine transport system ATPase subunit
MIVVTHEMRFAREVATRVVVIDDGLIIEEGAPEQVLENPRNDQTRRFLRAVLADIPSLPEAKSLAGEGH